MAYKFKSKMVLMEFAIRVMLYTMGLIIMTKLIYDGFGHTKLNLLFISIVSIGLFFTHYSTMKIVAKHMSKASSYKEV